MSYECISVDQAAIRIREPQQGYAWTFALTDRGGRRDLENERFEEHHPLGRRAPFTLLAGAFLFAVREARQRGLIDD